MRIESAQTQVLADALLMSAAATSASQCCLQGRLLGESAA